MIFVHTYPGFHADNLTFITVGHEIWIISIKTGEHVAVPNVNLGSVPQLIVDPNDELIYWSDYGSNTINSVTWDGISQRVIRKPKNGKCMFL